MRNKKGQGSSRASKYRSPQSWYCQNVLSSAPIFASECHSLSLQVDFPHTPTKSPQILHLTISVFEERVSDRFPHVLSPNRERAFWPSLAQVPIPPSLNQLWLRWGYVWVTWEYNSFYRNCQEKEKGYFQNKWGMNKTFTLDHKFECSRTSFLGGIELLGMDILTRSGIKTWLE